MTERATVAALTAEITTLHYERELALNVDAACQRILLGLVQGGCQESVATAIIDEITAALPAVEAVIISCDEQGIHWRIEAGTSIREQIATPSGMMLSVPEDLLLLQATGLSQRLVIAVDTEACWQIWQPNLSERQLSNAWVNCGVLQDNVVAGFILMLSSSEVAHQQAKLIELWLQKASQLISLLFMRQQAESRLLNSVNFDTQTGLMNPLSFESSFHMIMKDARRHFQRLAVICVNVHQGRIGWKQLTLADHELLLLADMLRTTVRDNDLVARFDHYDFVLGVRIRNLEDAEIVAKKILSALSLLSDELSESVALALGISFYPEHSQYDTLLAAAKCAQKDNNQTSGYRIEYHGRFCHTSSDLYEF